MNVLDFMKKNRPLHVQSESDLITKNSSPVLSEALKLARTNLMYALSDIEGGKCLLLTSALAGEGKTTTCINLAVSLAQTEARVLLIDADMRCPRMHTYLGLENKEGLANFLGGFADLESVVKRLDKYNLDCITAGALPPNPAEMLSSKKMKSFIEEAKEHYDYVIFDTPPVNIVADAQVLASLVKNVVFVLKCGKSLMTEVKKAIATLNFADAKILGFVAIEKNQKKQSQHYASYYSTRTTNKE